jgi:hypothetical protein
MKPIPYKNSKIIRFEGQMLPHWAHLLDLAATLSPVPESTRDWFSKFTKSSGVDDAGTVRDECALLQAGIKECRESMLAELRRTRDDSQPAQILGAWAYALDTMIQEASIRKTCSWIVEKAEEAKVDDADGGDIALRRV